MVSPPVAHGDQSVQRSWGQRLEPLSNRRMRWPGLLFFRLHVLGGMLVSRGVANQGRVSHAQSHSHLEAIQCAIISYAMLCYAMLCYAFCYAVPSAGSIDFGIPAT